MLTLGRPQRAAVHRVEEGYLRREEPAQPHRLLSRRTLLDHDVSRRDYSSPIVATIFQLLPRVEFHHSRHTLTRIHTTDVSESLKLPKINYE